MPTRQTVRTGKAAEMLGVGRDAITRYVDQGLLEGYTLPSGQRHVYLDSVKAELARRDGTVYEQVPE